MNRQLSNSQSNTLKLNKEMRLKRAKEYLNQIISQQNSRTKLTGTAGGMPDRRSNITHEDLVVMQDRIDSKSQVRVSNNGQLQKTIDGAVAAARMQ